MKRASLFVLCGVAVCAGVYATYRSTSKAPSATPTSLGKYLTPLDPGVDVGNYPANMAISPNGRFVAVTDTGYRQQVTLIDTMTGAVVSNLAFNKNKPAKEALYFGITFLSNDTIAVSRGVEDKISILTIDRDAQLSLSKDLSDTSANKDQPNYPAGICADRGNLYVAQNETYPGGSGVGHLAVMDASTGDIKASYQTHGFPLDVKVVGGKAFSASERDGCVDVSTASGSRSIKVGRNPSYMFVGSTGQLWVSNSGSDTVSLIDPSTEKVTKTILVRPAEVRGLPSCMPLGMTEYQGKLFVACGDLNAVAVIDQASKKLLGYIPTGWLPTSLAVTPDGKHLFVANAKGTKTRTPNGKAVAGKGTYILSVMEGTVSMIDLPAALKDLPAFSKMVIANNRYDSKREQTIRANFKNPGIKHVIYIVKENRTYDNVLGDMPEGNGDSSICLFPEAVTPNQHALARRFALLDNFNVCGDVSADGWLWSTTGMVNEYSSRNVPTNYSGRGRDYDEEGEVNGERVDLKGQTDVAESPGGYIWDLCRKSGVSMRNYGFFVGSTDQLGARPGTKQTTDDPLKRALIGVTDVNFREFDMMYPDSEAYTKYGFKPPRLMATFGKNKASSRIAEWKGEFSQYVKNVDLPQFMMLRLPRDHTSGTSVGLGSPRAMVADNDYAVGQVVDMVSHSPYWQSTVICVLEDDAQAGMDHVDCHRSPAYLISPYIARNTRTSEFYNTDSMLRTMELLLGMGPMNGFDAVADPINVFGTSLSNAEPYDAILPKKEIICEVNKATAYRSSDSAVLLRRMGEDSVPDLELNDILWGDFVRHRDAKR